MPQHKCSFGDGITVKPDGKTELDPCLYQEIETYENVTLHIEVEWERQDNTIDITEMNNE